MNKNELAQVEHVDAASSLERQATTNTAGEVRLFDGDDVFLIPIPSSDPKDPLNYPSWKKWSILVLVSAYSSTAVLLSSGMGAIFSVVSLSTQDKSYAQTTSRPSS